MSSDIDTELDKILRNEKYYDWNTGSVDIIAMAKDVKQLINSIVLEAIGEDEPISYGHGQIGNTSEEDRNELRSEQRQSLQKKLGGGR